MILRRNRSQRNYCSRSPKDVCPTIRSATRHFVLLQTGIEEEDWKLMAGTIVSICPIKFNLPEAYHLESSFWFYTLHRIKILFRGFSREKDWE